MIGDERENLRRSYRPMDIKMLFIGESPPSSGDFFYKGNGSFYIETKKVCEEVWPPMRWPEAKSFLEWFKALRSFVDDLCHEPVDHLPYGGETRKRKHVDAVACLTRRIEDAKPSAIIIVGIGIWTAVDKAIVDANASLVARPWDLPFAGQGHQRAYRRGLEAAFRTLRRQRVLPDVM